VDELIRIATGSFIPGPALLISSRPWRTGETVHLTADRHNASAWAASSAETHIVGLRSLDAPAWFFRLQARIPEITNLTARIRGRHPAAVADFPTKDIGNFLRNARKLLLQSPGFEAALRLTIAWSNDGKILYFGDVEVDRVNTASVLLPEIAALFGDMAGWLDGCHYVHMTFSLNEVSAHERLALCNEDV